MEEDIDIFSLLRYYAARMKRASFTFAEFVAYIQKYAKRFVDAKPELERYLMGTEAFVASELGALAQDGKLSLEESDYGIESISLPQYYADVVLREYKRIEEGIEIPFPSEDSLNLIVPPELIRPISVDNDLFSVMEARAAVKAGVLLYRITFSEGLKPMVAPIAMLPRKVLEFALLKIRNYLRAQNNKDYIQHKLLGAFQNREVLLKEAMNTILVKPYEAIEQIEKPNDFTFTFWAYTTNFIKSDFQKKNEKLAEDYALLQSLSLIEFFNNYYKGRSQKELAAQTALKNLEQCLGKSPYYYTMEEIERFTDSQGVPLLGKYTQTDLQAWLTKKTSSPDKESLPALIPFRVSPERRYYVLKDKILPLCVRLLGETRQELRSKLIPRWRDTVQDYRSLPAMEDDEDYRKELKAMVAQAQPILSVLLNYDLLALVFEDMQDGDQAVPEAARFFDGEALAPLDVLLNLPRRDLLTDVKVLLPFWYSMPFLASILGFFKRMGEKSREGKKQKEKRIADVEIDDEEDALDSRSTTADRRAELRQAAARVERQLVPEGYDLDDYIDELESRWNTLINQVAKDNLRADVDSLIRDFLRKSMRSTRASTFTLERVASLAETLADSPTFLKIKNRGALETYMQAYMVRLIKK
jgi:hypothetical protein